MHVVVLEKGGYVPPEALEGNEIDGFGRLYEKGALLTTDDFGNWSQINLSQRGRACLVLEANEALGGGDPLSDDARKDCVLPTRERAL